MSPQISSSSSPTPNTKHKILSQAIHQTILRHFGEMASPSLFLTGTLIFLLTITSSHALVNPSAPKAISDLKEAIVKGLGFQTEDFKISGFDIRDSLVGQSVAYEFHIEIDNKVLPFKLLEDVNRWQHVDLPVLRTHNQEDIQTPNSNSLSSVNGNQRLDDERVLPVLAPFQLAGPMELWIQDAKDMRLSLPHDVDAGVLKKVILADGAVVTVKGARSVSLRQPLELPLPLNTTSEGGFASGLLTLSERLRVAAQNQETPIVSVRIVGPTSLTSPSDSTTPRASNRLKLKRLAPGLVELSSPPSKIEAVSGLHEEIGITTMWPLAAVNGSNSNLRGFETLLYSVLGEKANKKGSFKLLKAEASAQTFLKMVFGVEKELKEGDKTVDWEEFPAWKTKPESVKMHFEVLAKVDGDKVVPEKVMQVPDPFVIEDSVAPNVLMGNLTTSSLPVIYPPPNFFTL